jgi:mRNA-degrading endonuclease RelE of RelBE toxin-antitoxin system
MSYKIFITPVFKKLFKKLLKKYPSLKNDLQNLSQNLINNPEFGVSLGHGLYKVRMPISSKRKGRSGGARVISYLIIENEEIYLVYIYDKSELENITKQQLIKLLKKSGLIQ